jgi:putative membrane protein
VRRAREAFSSDLVTEEIKMIRLPALILFTLAFLAPAFGQSASPASPAPGNPGGMAPGTRESAPGVPASHQTNQPDRAFIHAAALGGLAEVELGNLAARKGSSRPVKEFAQRMIRDHSAANDKLSALAKTDGIPLPNGLDEEHKAMRGRIEQSSGMEFDRAYIQNQIIDHQKTAQLLEYEIGSGENAAAKDFASDLLPNVLDHLRAAQTIAAELYQTAAAPPGDQAFPSDKVKQKQ